MIAKRMISATAAVALLMLGLVLGPAAVGKEPKDGKPAKQEPAPKPLFASTEVLRITITAPFSTLTQGGAKAEAGVAGTLSTQGANPESHAVTLAPRGIKRRDPEICPFPPLWVSFAEKPAKNTLFKGQKRLKLVTHCRPAAKFQQHVLLEYAAYRINTLLTPASFQARLAMIDYVNEKGERITTRLGFFIEDADDMAKRNGLHEINAPNRVASAQIIPQEAVRYALFQMMIGNLDWAMNAGAAGQACCHNSKLIGAKDATSGLLPVPYDFDYSGLVGAPYAAPPVGIPVSSVKVRRYRGFCRHNALVPAMVQSLPGKRNAVLAELRAVPQLEDRARAEAIEYIDGFFQQISSQPDFAEKAIKTCL